MSRSSARRSLVLVFGENLNDAQSVATLLVHMEPSLRGRVRPRPRPTSLTRDAGSGAVRTWAEQLRRTVAAVEAAGTPVAAVVVHQDADGPDATGAREQALRRQLRGAADHVAVPVEEMESWWLLHPTAVEALRPRSWSSALPRSPREVDRVQDPKETLIRATRPSGHPYTEADSPAVASQIASGHHAPVGTSASWTRFTETSRAVAAEPR